MKKKLYYQINMQIIFIHDHVILKAFKSFFNVKKSESIGYNDKCFKKNCIHIRFIPNCSTYFYILETLLCKHIKKLQPDDILI
jgi:hypothetical protein